MGTSLSGEESRVVAEEQAALRRVATLVARGVPPGEVFTAITKEVERLLSAATVALGRYEPDGTMTVVATSGTVADRFPVDGRWTLGGKNIVTIVSETGRSARIDSYADASGSVGAAVREEGAGSGVGTPIVVEGHLWGVMTARSRPGQPLPPDAEERLANFTELVATAIANTESRAALGVLADEQAALRRVATQVARGLPPTAIFAAVAEEIGKLVSIDGTRILRYEADGTATVVAGWSEAVEVPPELEVGARLALEGESVSAMVFGTGGPARIDDYANTGGPLSKTLQSAGVRSAAGAPIIVEGHLWGVITAGSTQPGPLPPGIEFRLAEFTELVATAIANAEGRAGLARLAEEQAALRRIATLAAGGTPPEELFAVVTAEVGRLLGTHFSGMARYENDDTVTVLATWAEEDEHGGAHPLVPGPWPLEGGDLATTIARTGRPVRIDDYHGVPGRIAAFVRDELGIGSSLASPIVVEGRLWGVLFVHTKQTHPPLPMDAESRLTGFTELVETAIANAESRSELAASRARIVAASDETRRRIERDLHDGAQQQLVTLGLALRSAQAELPDELEDVRAELSHVQQGMTDVLDELREISRGIHPAILSERGLAPALKILARRSPTPVALDVRVEGRLPDGVEVATYYVVSEMLTNTAKHAQASAVYVDVTRVDGVLHICVRDDGVGGADPARGSGLVGLRDRVEALGGTIAFRSAKGAGTAVNVLLPLERTVDDPLVP
jgi:signal transduction histidine kinase